MKPRTNMSSGLFGERGLGRAGGNRRLDDNIVVGRLGVIATAQSENQGGEKQSRQQDFVFQKFLLHFVRVIFFTADWFWAVKRQK